MNLVGGPDQTWGHLYRVGPGWGDPELPTRGIKRLLATAFKNGWAVGVDTETVGCNPASSGVDGNPWLSAVPVVFSLGIPGEQMGSRGQRLAHRALVHAHFLPSFRGWLESEQAPKTLHHEQYDRSALQRLGIKLAGVVGDTMERVRVSFPEASRGLKGRMIMDLGYQPVCNFEDFAAPVFTTKTVAEHFPCPYERGRKLDLSTRAVTWAKTKVRPHEDCNWHGCKLSAKRGSGYWHAVKKSVQVELARRVMIPVTTLCDPEHHLHQQFVDYATLDAKATAELWSLPWPKDVTEGRPSLRVPKEWM